MPWWGWIIFGALLLGSELLIVDAGFYLVFIGIAAAAMAGSCLLISPRAFSEAQKTGTSLLNVVVAEVSRKRVPVRQVVPGCGACGPECQRRRVHVGTIEILEPEQGDRE